MPIVTFIDAEGQETKADIAVGDSVMQGAINNGVEGIAAECGGACACGTCHCYVDDAWVGSLSPADENEMGMLEFVVDPTAQSRLSCQLTVNAQMDGLIVRLPRSQT